MPTTCRMSTVRAARLREGSPFHSFGVGFGASGRVGNCDAAMSMFILSSKLQSRDNFRPRSARYQGTRPLAEGRSQFPCLLHPYRILRELIDNSGHAPDIWSCQSQLAFLTPFQSIGSG